MLRALTLSLLLALPGQGQPGQSPGQPTRALRDIEDVLRPAIRAYTGRAGLPNNTVYGLAEDPKGRLWAATKDGAEVYDGRVWTNLAIPGVGTSNSVRVTLHDRTGAHWLGMENGGLWRLKDGQWSHFQAGAELPHARVNCLKETQDPDGNPSLWVGTGGGLARFKQGQWRSWPPGPKSPFDTIWKFVLHQHAQGKEELWAATSHGFARFEGDAWQPAGGAEGFPTWEVNDLVQIRQRNGASELWVSCWDHGLWRYDGRRWQTFGPGNGFPSLRPTMLVTTPGAGGEPVLWVSTYDAGLVCREKNEWKVLNEDKGLPANGVYAILPSDEGRPTLWLGLRGAGVVAVDRSGWLNLDKGRELPSNGILAFLDGKDPQGRQRFWVGTERGLVSWNGLGWHGETPMAGFPHMPIAALLQEKDGTLWAGGLKGLARNRGQRWEWLQDPLVKEREVTTLLETAGPGGARVLWIGQEGGLVLLQKERFEQVAGPPGVFATGVYSLLETTGSDGVPCLWAGSRGGGLAMLRDGQWTVQGPKEGLPNQWVYCLQNLASADGQRWLWAGTFGGGLARLALTGRPERWQVFNSDTLPGLPSNSIVGLEADDRGRLYLATANGVTRLAFDDPGRPGQPTSVETYNLADGLPALQCNNGAFLKDARGRLWVGTNRGAAMLDPTRESIPSRSRTIVLDRVLVRGQERALQPGAALGHRESYLTFECFLPTFHRGEEIRYRTQLEGLEPEPGPWTPEGRREFPALPSGHFILRVWAVDYRGRIYGPLAFPFQVRPAPWRSPWAYLAYALSAALALAGAHLLRIRLLKERNRLLEARIQAATEELRLKNADLERIMEEKTKFMGIAAHDIRNPLSGMLLAIEQMQSGNLAPEELRHFTAMIERAARQMSELLQNMLGINRMDTGRLQLASLAINLNILVLEIAEDYRERAAAKDIQLVAELPEEELRVWADLTHLTEAVENLLSNALKFTPRDPFGRKVWLRVAREGERILLAVRDQGPGFTEADKSQVFGRFQKLSARPTAGEPSSGLGLSIVKALVEAMDGQVELESRTGHGATFRILLPEAPAEEA